MEPQERPWGSNMELAPAPCMPESLMHNCTAQWGPAASQACTGPSPNSALSKFMPGSPPPVYGSSVGESAGGSAVGAPMATGVAGATPAASPASAKPRVSHIANVLHDTPLHTRNALHCHCTALCCPTLHTRRPLLGYYLLNMPYYTALNLHLNSFNDKTSG